MTITLELKLANLIQKRLESGAFETVQDVLLQAIESHRMRRPHGSPHQLEVSDKIDRAIAQADNGAGMPPDQYQAWLEEQKTQWRSLRAQ